MRPKKTFKRICVEESIYDQLIKDRDDFKELMDCKTWSISDTIREHRKILKTIKRSKPKRSSNSTENKLRKKNNLLNRKIIKDTITKKGKKK